jgi:hypothetical protein
MRWSSVYLGLGERLAVIDRDGVGNWAKAEIRRKIT